ncbi:MAG: cbb3-type cytochrome oxidase assembly protein CcoS [Herminiimonas sp.]|nr:cbb3-type cytochrome oxidase assembly protein CcoS [Herminiimonas sp.]
MEALYLLVPLSIGIVFVAIRVFFWMSDSGQFDDMVGPGLRVLEDHDEAVPTPPTGPATDAGKHIGEQDRT